MSSRGPEAPMFHRKDAFSTIIDVDQRTCDHLGGTTAEWVGSSTLRFLHPEDHDVAVATWFAMIETPGATTSALLRWKRDDGWVWMRSTNRNLLDERGYVESELVPADPPPDGVAVSLTEPVDGTVRDSATIAGHLLREHSRAVRRLIQALPIGMAHLSPTQQILATNDQLRHVFGTPSASDGSELSAGLAPASRTALLDALAHAVDHHTDSDLELVVERPGGEPRLLAVNVRAFADGGDDDVLLCAVDVTEHARLARELEHRATTDLLTGCANRHTILDLLQRRLVDDGSAAVLYVDLDGFKHINDRAGHAAGDAVLRAVAGVLRAVADRDDAVGRLGGDEFLVVCRPGLDASALSSFRDDLEAAIAGIRIDAIDVGPVRASVGAAISEPGTADADEVVAAADADMYAHKRRRRRAGDDLSERPAS